MSLDLRKQSLRHVYATFGPADGHGLPINEHLARCLEELEQWMGVKMHLGNGTSNGQGVFEAIGYGEKPTPWRHDDDEDDDDEDDDDE